MNIIELEKWAPSSENLEKMVYSGQRTAVEVFEELRQRLDRLGCLPDEYFLLDTEWENFREIPRGADIFCCTDYGESEGIYIDVYLVWYDNEKRLQKRFIIGKTLEDSGKALDRMFLISSAITKAFHGEKGCYPRTVSLDEPEECDGAILSLTLPEQSLLIQALLEKRERLMENVDSTEQLLRRLTGSVTAFMDLVGERPIQLSVFEKALLAVRDGELRSFTDTLPHALNHGKELLQAAAGRCGSVGEKMTQAILDAVPVFPKEDYMNAFKNAASTGDSERILLLLHAAETKVEPPMEEFYGEALGFLFSEKWRLAQNILRRCENAWISALSPKYLMKALWEEDHVLAEVLIQKGISTDGYALQIFRILQKKNSLWAAESLIRAGLSLDASELEVLDICVRSGNGYLAKLLLEKGYDLDAYRSWIQARGLEAEKEECFQELLPFWREILETRQEAEEQ